MKTSINSKKKHGLKRFILVISACLAVLMAGSSVNAASCIDLADIPLDALEQAAPGLIMFVLDDSGSMDWSTMTPPTSGESSGTFDGMEYVFHNPGDDVYGTREHIEDFDTHRMMWMSQWSGYNGMYYNPGTEYTPWPTLSNVNVDNPPSHPMSAANTLDMTALWHQWNSVGVVVDNDDVGYSENIGILTPGTWMTWGTGWNGNSRENLGAGTVSAQWEASAATGSPLNPSILYDVQVRWPVWGGYDKMPQFEVWDGGSFSTTSAPMDQSINSNTWMTIATDVSFTTGIGIVKIPDTVVTADWQINADAVQFVPKNNISDVARRHYFVQNASGTYLVNLLNGVIEYYRVDLADPTDNREVVTADKLVRLTNADASSAGIITGRTYAAEIQNFANWYSFYRRRELTAINAIANSINTMDGVYVGIISINGKLAQRVLPVRVLLDGVTQDDSATLLTTLYGLTITSQGTPLRNGLKNAGRFFQGNYLKPTTFASQTSSANYPFFNADKGGTCQQAFTIIFTDGFYNGSDPGVADADSDNSHPPYDGPPFADGAGNTLADVAMYYFERDLNTNLANNVPVTNVDPADHQHMVTFTIAFGVTGSLDTTLYANCPLGACPSPWPDTASDSGKIDDMFHAAVNGRGQFIAANNNEELLAALDALGNDIDSRLGSAAALATNSIQRQVGSVIYQGTYNTANWYGDVSALPLDLTTGNVGAPLWQASTSVPAWNARHILSHDGTAGILFDAGNLTAAQVTQLEASGLGTAAQIVDYLRGDPSNSVDNGGILRNRNHPLGDVVHSAPIYFEGMVYIGANDGMLHGLNAATGEELFAYVPNLVYDNLSELAFQGYSHKFYVDGTATVVKVGGRNVLVSGLGKGGKGYFALDVTDPTAMDPTDVLWEFSAGTDPDMGYSFGRTFIVNTEAAGKVVIFSNGYDSANGSAVLYVRDALTGGHIAKFDTKVTGCNGLATPAAVDVELDGYVDYVYAGDLKGNMWKFDLRGASTGDWTFGYGDTVDPKPLISVKNINGDIQPITSPPQVMLDCASDGDVRGLMVIFGTGRYLNTDDFVNTPVNSYYGIWDRGPLIEDTDGLTVARTKYLGTFEADRSLTNMSGVTLLEQVFEVVGTEFSALTDRPADWYDPAAGSGTHVGWYWDMPDAGERMIRDPLLRGGHAILISTVPSASPCDSGGTSFINIVNACTGGRPYSPQFDVNKDQKITPTDKILDPFGNPIPPSRQEKNKIIFTPLEVGDMLYLPDSEGGHGSMPVVPIRAGMFFWRVIGQ